jgi:hypothetical protein
MQPIGVIYGSIPGSHWAPKPCNICTMQQRRFMQTEKKFATWRHCTKVYHPNIPRLKALAEGILSTS